MCVACDIFFQYEEKMIGTRLEVYRGTKQRTAGGLRKKDLAKNKHGKIVSKKVQKQAKKKSNLAKYLKQK